MGSVRILGVPEKSLGDVEFDTIIEGLTPEADHSFALETRDDGVQEWRIERCFRATETGTISVPILDLLSSLRPAHLSEGPVLSPFRKLELTPMECRFRVRTSAGVLLAECSFQRLMQDENVICEKISPDHPKGSGFAGEFYFKRGAPLAESSLVLVFGGSGGGLSFSRIMAARLASCGIPALALAYFAYPGCPEELIEIPLEYFRDAIRWLRTRASPSGDPRDPSVSVTLIGGSRGGELALLLGSHYPDEVNGIVARVPSHLVWGGIGKSPMPKQELPAWTLGGSPLEFVRIDSLSQVRRAYEERRQRGEFFSLAPLFFEAMEEQRALCERARIPVEKIRCPLLLISAEDDQCWPSTWFSEQVVARMRESGKGVLVRHLSYAGAGHTIPFPGFPSTVHALVHPVDGGKYQMGGTDEGDAKAARDSWRAILEFISEHSKALFRHGRSL